MSLIHRLKTQLHSFLKDRPRRGAEARRGELCEKVLVRAPQRRHAERRKQQDRQRELVRHQHEAQYHAAAEGRHQDLVRRGQEL